MSGTWLCYFWWHQVKHCQTCDANAGCPDCAAAPTTSLPHLRCSTSSKVSNESFYFDGDLLYSSTLCAVQVDLFDQSRTDALGYHARPRILLLNSRQRQDQTWRHYKWKTYPARYYQLIKKQICRNLWTPFATFPTCLPNSYMKASLDSWRISPVLTWSQTLICIPIWFLRVKAVPLLHRFFHISLGYPADLATAQMQISTTAFGSQRLGWWTTSLIVSKTWPH